MTSVCGADDEEELAEDDEEADDEVDKVLFMEVARTNPPITITITTTTTTAVTALLMPRRFSRQSSNRGACKAAYGGSHSIKAFSEIT
jgi:hypothetical protein